MRRRALERDIEPLPREELTAGEEAAAHPPNLPTSTVAVFGRQAVAREMVKNSYGMIINAASIGGKGLRGTSNIADAAPRGPSSA